MNLGMDLDNSHIGLLNRDDKKAFKQFFEGFFPSVCIYAGKYLKDNDLAEDFAQEAFIEFWKSRGTFADIKAIKGFIYTVTRNKCLNYLKITGIRENIIKNDLLSDDYFYELILEEETYSIVYNAVNKLPPQSRKIIWLSLEGNKNQDIAERLAISVNTVKTLKKNAYKELRSQLKDHIYILFLLSHFLN
jgi:RNA polymerase sigma-70 factor (family 1)